MPSGADSCAQRPATLDPQAGFSLIEVIVSIAVMSIVMSALTVSYAKTNAFISQQSNRQAAIRLAVDGMEKVQGIRGAAVSTQLTDIGDTAAVKVDKITYTRSYAAVACWQPLAGGSCGATQTAGSVSLQQITVTVKWNARNCPSTGCTYDATTLVSDGVDEPMFNSDATPATPALPPLIVKTPSCTLFFFFQISGCSSGLTTQIQASGGSGQYQYSYKDVTGFLIGFLLPSVNTVTGKVQLSFLSLLLPLPSLSIVSVKDKITGKTVSSRLFIWFPW